MLKKLIKYEFKATRSFMFLLYGLLIAVSVLMSFMIHFNTVSDGNFNIGANSFTDTVLSLFVVLIVIAYAFLNIAALSAMFFYAIERFRTNLLGSEGYLMHTLPVSVKNNIFAKTTVSVLWTLIGILAVVISCLIVFAGTSGMHFFYEIAGIFKSTEFRKVFTNAEIYLTLGETVLCGLVMLINGYLHIYASMSAGYSFNNHRALASVVIYLLISTAFNVLQVILINILYNASFFDSSNIHALLWGEIIFVSLTGSIYYFITEYFMRRRLNLQ